MITLGLVLATLKRYGNGDLTLKTHQMFSSALATSETIENENTRRPFWICLWEKLEKGNHVIMVT